MYVPNRLFLRSIELRGSSLAWGMVFGAAASVEVRLVCVQDVCVDVADSI